MIFLKLFLIFFKIGAFTFGGGYAMLPLVQQEVLNNGWMTQSEIIDFIAISESTPGPIAVNMSTYVGYITGGIPGAFFATLGVALPSFIVILIVAKLYDRFRNSHIVKGCMMGLRPVVVGLIAAAAFSIIVSVFNISLSAGLGMINLENILKAVLLLFVIIAVVKKVNPMIIIAGSAVVGILVNYLII